MTYILGLKQPGINAIIADCRKTYLINGRVSSGQNIALKTGLLFPGCIFGRTGSAERSQEFIVAFKQSIVEKIDTPKGFWQRFERFIDSYKFPQGEHDRFKILLSRRVIGFPLFATLDSAEGLSTDHCPDENYIVSGGSGRSALDSLVADTFIPRLKSLLEYLLANKAVPNIGAARMLSPYFLCLWLSELSLTHEKIWLESPAIGVGGVFHFILQTHHGEFCQHPAVYIFSTRDEKTSQIYSWVYRVAYVYDGLYLESITPPGQEQEYPGGKIDKEAYFDIASRLDATTENLVQKEKVIKEELDSLKYYYFCGFGFTSPSERNSFWSVISPTGARQEIFNDDWSFTPLVKRVIANSFDDVHT